MNVLIKARFEAAAQQHPNDASGLNRLYRLLLAAEPRSYSDLEKTFGKTIDLFRPRADQNWVAIDVGGNNLRVIGGVHYDRQMFFTKHIYTHREYDEANKWYRRHKEGVKP